MHDAPVKYVWNGNTRVARVTGSLNTNLRVQRLRLWPGWNLVSLAVTATNALQQLSLAPIGGEGQGERAVRSAFKWSRPTLDWQLVLSGETLSAGTVLWLRASTNATLTITGAYTDPTNRTVTTTGDFLPSAGLEVWNLKSTISNLPFASAWTYDGLTARWLASVPSPLQSQSDLPLFIAPSQAVFTRADADADAQLEVPDSALRIRYYHQDHLGSALVITDAGAVVVEESSNYSFGYSRSDFRRRSRSENYRFTQKELDFESGFSYFESRLLNSKLGRFLSRDRHPEELCEPQSLNGYAYVENNPLRFIDSQGFEKETVIVSPGHGVSTKNDPAGGGAIFGKYKEISFIWNLTSRLIPALKKTGFDVINTKATGAMTAKAKVQAEHKVQEKEDVGFYLGNPRRLERREAVGNPHFLCWHKQAK